MPTAVHLALAALVVCALAATIMGWGRLSPHARRLASLATSAVGMLFLVLALGTEGHRAAATTTQFLMGGSRYVTGHASASASLSYYVVTAVCLLLGTAGLAVPDDVARRLDRHWFSLALAVSVLATAVRFSLEKVVAPHAWSMAVGVTWLAPVVGAFFWSKLREDGRGWRALVGYLCAYGFLVRAMVAGLMVLATRNRLGTHYDVGAVYAMRMPISERVYAFEPASWSQVLNLGVFPQLTFWPTYTLLAGLLGAAVFAALKATPPLSLGAPKIEATET
jgi:hypothetical protein